MAKVPNGVETLPKILIACVCTNVTDRRTATTYSHRLTVDEVIAKSLTSRFFKHSVYLVCSSISHVLFTL